MSLSGILHGGNDATALNFLPDTLSTLPVKWHANSF